MIRLVLTLLFIVSLSLSTSAETVRGIPFFRNFPSKDYHAHSRNYDIASDNYGTIFVANFEGLVYYDGVSWRKIHTPGISRVTRLVRDHNGRVWVGGYNVFGYIQADNHGRIKLKTIVSDANKGALSEVDFIKVTKQKVYVHTVADKLYYVEGDKRLREMKKDSAIYQPNAIDDSIRHIKLSHGIEVKFSHTSGMNFGNGRYAFMPLTEAEGLQSNAINFANVNSNNMLWGATDNGIFSVDVMSPFGRFTEKQGLKGEVNSINQLNGTYYIGTTQGLFRIEGGKLKMVSNIDLSCWQLTKDDAGNLLASTSQGLYLVTPSGTQTITTFNTLSVAKDKQRGGYYTGEVDGVYYIATTGKKTKISTLEKVMKMQLNGDRLTVESIYGELWEITLRGTDASITSSERCLRQTADTKKPRISYIDQHGTAWETDAEGKNLRITNSRTDYEKILAPWIYPFTRYTLTCLYVSDDSKVWVGTEQGIIILDVSMARHLRKNPVQRPYIREVVAMGDSVVWGGYSPNGMKALYTVSDIHLPSSCNHLTVRFSTPYSSIVCPTLYRYRIDGGRWSKWETDYDLEMTHLSYGTNKIEIQALDQFERMSEISSVTCIVAIPFYLRWWAFLIYALLLGGIIYQLTQWRTQRLEAEKEKLETIVAERTSELAASNTQLTAVNSQLSDTLDDLKRTQNDLVRMERKATVGKLTQGLIDRILNPINYINNFSKLTSGLAHDLQEDLEDEKDNMTEDNYEDCEDILSMMNTNLKKIEEHGVSTTRTLRAMEAMLNTHVGHMAEHNLTSLCRQMVTVAKEHYKDLIAQNNISIVCDLPDEKMLVSMDAESIKNVILSLINNSIYSVAKKAAAISQPTREGSRVIIAGSAIARSTDYKPVITLRKPAEGAGFIIHDNGVGIEEAIIDKVFDPFFTTKPTGDATGVGLYLVRTIIHDHHGKITVESKKDEYCQFEVNLS